MQDRSREIAKQVVEQWDKHDRFRAVNGEDNSEPNEVILARALLRVDAEYGCEVRDPCGTIWDHAASLEKKLTECRKKICDLRSLLVCVLQEEEVANGFGSGAISKELMNEIEDALANNIINNPELPDSSERQSQ